MPEQIDDNDPKHAQAAAEILRRHNRGEAEANITTAVRDFLIVTGLVKADEMVEENPPAQGSRRAVDLTALDTFVEFKRRLGTTGGFNPNPEFVQQIDDYLAQSQAQGRMRMGVLTDGKYWLLRWPGAGTVRTTPPYGFTSWRTRTDGSPSTSGSGTTRSTPKIASCPPVTPLLSVLGRTTLLTSGT